jgi:DNA helicase-2/ATP-dependent DNA helicase PcrA
MSTQEQHRTPLPSAEEPLMILGGPGTGKTQVLVDHVGSLIEDGTAPEDILVLTASPDGASAFAARLARRIPSAPVVRVTTPRELELSILGDPEAIASTGRDARLLSPYEADFLAEDMKTCGMKPRRLREMLKFFFRSMSELADDDGQWLISDEERATFDLLKSRLGFIRGILEPELGNLCVNYLRSHPEALHRHARRFVVVDDFQQLSRASQFTACLLAAHSLWASADPEGSVAVFESYPYAEGVQEFIDANGAEHVQRLPQSRHSDAVVHAVNGLRTQPPIGAAAILCSGIEGSVTHLSCTTPDEEVASLADRVSEAVQAGTPAGRIYVTGGTRLGRHRMAEALAERDIPIEMAFDAHVLSGDHRNLDTCRAARMACALELAANPQDAVAWRSWCGFGDHIANASTLQDVMRIGDARGLSLDATLEEIDRNPALADGTETPAGLERVMDAYRQGRRLIDDVHGMRGDALIEALAQRLFGDDAKVPAAIVRLTAPLRDLSDDAAGLAARMQARLVAPRFERTDAVHVGPVVRLCGMDVDAVFFEGFVNGTMPSRAYFDPAAMEQTKRDALYERCLRLLGTALGTTHRDLAIGTFTEVGLAEAERTGLNIDRVRIKDGTRIARVSPSIFVAAMTEGPEKA